MTRRQQISFHSIAMMIAGSIIPVTIFAALALLYVLVDRPANPFADIEPRVVATSFAASF